MNVVKKIIQEHMGYSHVDLKRDNHVMINLDFIYSNGLTLASAVKELNKMGKCKLWDVDKLAVFPDHFTPNKDIPTANLKKGVREWVKFNHIKNYYEVGDVGIEHVQFVEEGYVAPGSIVIGGDSHSCSLGALGILSFGVGTTDLAYGLASGKMWLRIPNIIRINLEGTNDKKYFSGKDVILKILRDFDPQKLNYSILVFSGRGCHELNFNDRFTISNMSVEGGAKTAFFYPESKILKAINYKNTASNYLDYNQENDEFDEVYTVNLEDIDYQVSLPDLPRNSVSVNELSPEEVALDQVFIGSCTNGHIDDFRIVADILKNKKRNSDTRLIIIPSTPSIYKQALEEGLIKIFLDAGAVIGPPTCGPCLGGHMGVLGDGETCLATTNRNFKGRMGSTESRLYLSSPAVAAASAVTGYIANPEVVK